MCIALYMGIKFSWYHLLKGLSFLYYAFYSKINFKFIELYGGFILCLINLCVCFSVFNVCTSGPYCFDYCQFGIYFEIARVVPSISPSFFQDSFDNPRFFVAT